MDAINKFKKENKMHLKKKRKLKNGILIKNEKISKKRAIKSLFESILDNSKKINSKQENTIKEVLKESE